MWKLQIHHNRSCLPRKPKCSFPGKQVYFQRMTNYRFIVWMNIQCHVFNILVVWHVMSLWASFRCIFHRMFISYVSRWNDLVLMDYVYKEGTELTNFYMYGIQETTCINLLFCTRIMLCTVGYVAINTNQKWTFMHKNNVGLSCLFKSYRNQFFLQWKGSWIWLENVARDILIFIRCNTLKYCVTNTFLNWIEFLLFCWTLKMVKDTSWHW